MTSGVTVEWLALLLLIREVMGSDLGLETGYADSFFVFFFQYVRPDAGLVPQIRPRPLPSVSFSCNCH